MHTLSLACNSQRMSESISRKCWRFAPDGVCFCTQQIFSILRPIYRETAVGSWFSDKLNSMDQTVTKTNSLRKCALLKKATSCLFVLGFCTSMYMPFDKKTNRNKRVLLVGIDFEYTFEYRYSIYILF